MPAQRRAWAQLHFSQRGSYSVERLQEFNGYCKKTSLWRAVFVCLVFSLPALLTSIVLELIPLQNPFNGVKANHGAWTRLFVTAFMGTTALLVQINQLVPQLALSAAQIILTSSATSSCYIVLMVIIASCWVYPIPFGMVIGILPFVAIMFTVVLCVVGLRRIRSSSSLQRELRVQINIVIAQAVLAVIYPVFIAIYRQLNSMQKMFFVVLLPVIKLAMQQFVAWSARDLEDYQPGIVVFCVEVFNALYAAKSMQSANQTAGLTILLILGVDVCEFGLTISGLHHKVQRANQLLARVARTQISDQPLVDAAVALCERKSVLSNGASSIRLHSSRLSQQNQVIGKHSVTQCASQRFLLRMREKDIWRSKVVPSGGSGNAIVRVKSASQGPFRVSITTKSSSDRSARVASSQIQESVKAPRVRIFNRQAEELSRWEQQELVYLTLKLLFECEYYLLVGYVECIVPTMYAIYVAVARLLPSAAYYPETQDLSANQSQEMVLNLVFYAGLETLSFLLLHAVIKKRCGFSPTFLLAFVLENQALEFQGRLFMWYVFLLEFTLAHFGKNCPCPASYS